ncbi:MAG: hypothetical protein HW407_1408, partial [Bacteroidetes bacterium]|nr:hypothetical protein [Bacteroidota bacterium]
MKRRLLLFVFLIHGHLSSQSLSGLKFCIDPGHGGYESDDRHVIPEAGIDFWESESNFYKAIHLKALLEAQGATVILTRMGNSDPDIDDPSLSARWTLANANNVDWFHSIHSNATGGNNTSVNHTLLLLKENISTRLPVFPQAVTMSSYIYNQIRGHLRTQSSGGNLTGYPGVYSDYTFYGGTNGGFNLGVLNGLTMPGELSEGSFHDYSPETRRLMNNYYRKMEAYGLVKAFMQYFSSPADTFGIVSGLQFDNLSGKPKNQTVVRLLPGNRIYSGDSFNNGFYMFDSLTPGSHTLIFETPRYNKDTVGITVTAGSLLFFDRTLTYSSFPFVTATTPPENDTIFPVKSSVAIFWSTPMDTASLRTALSFSPQASGTISWSGDKKTLTFSPTPDFKYFTRYTMKIDSSARSETGYGIDQNGDGIGGDAFSVLFRTETGLQVPAVAFGQAKRNDTASSYFRIRNRAPYQTIVRAISTITSPFRIDAVLPDTIVANDSLLLPVYFNPTVYGSFNQTIVVSSDSGTMMAGISGSSPTPSLYLSHTVQGFGSVSADTSRERFLFVTSTSINEVRIDTIYTKTPRFAFLPLPVFPFNLKSGDTLNATMRFTPQTVGSYTDTLLIFNNTAFSPARVILIGTGETPTGVDRLSGIVARYDLLQNYPNPFNPETTIEFQIPETSPVKLEIIDVLGRSVRILLTGEANPGKYRVRWDGTNDAGMKVASGVYVYRLSAGSYEASRKVVLLK